MNFLGFFIGSTLGAITAFLFLKTQSWSVMVITPQRPKFSKGLVIGGAVLRWLMVFLLLALALSYSIFAALVEFITFMLVRLLILFFWQDFIMPKAIKSTSMKDR